MGLLNIVELRDDPELNCRDQFGKLVETLPLVETLGLGTSSGSGFGDEAVGATASTKDGFREAVRA